MAIPNRRHARALFGASILALLASGPLLADTIFTPTSDGFIGDVSAAAPDRAPIYAGTTVAIQGEGLTPGQQITLMRGTTVLNADGPLTVAQDGTFSLDVTVDEDAATGLHPIVVIGENPAAATVVDLKVSPEIPVSGQDKFAILSQPVTRGLYQVAYSPKSDALFVTSAVGRPPVRQSALVKVNPDTLETIASVTPEAAPADGVFAVYGVAVDDANGTVWVTNTRQDTVAVYRQDDLSLVKQFEPGAAPHPRDVVIDGDRGRAYVSTSMGPEILVFDTRMMEQLDPITVPSTIRGEEFGTMALDLDARTGTLVTASLNTPEAAVIDLNSGAVKVFAIKGAQGTAGAAYDAGDGLLFVTAQKTDNLLILKADTGEVLHDVDIGAGPLNVTFDPVSRHAFVANRGSGTITVVDTEGRIVANLDAGSFPNQLRADGKGNVYAVNKSRGEDDEAGDRVWRIHAN
ncbi:ATP-binding protein [Paracoccus sp. YIM 132242]|uniref:ATP-binding protein n=1 Tax=Paracoccus lichenicola TaxID=2665644 RepID=A0A6L6HVI1_9RHOB|nr:ATP-binding protein [Paracoccus lichenicola]MTE01318.1 ATP-binding protein [Paracoccus lichenicola]